MVNIHQDDNLILVVDDSPDTLGMLNQAIEKANMTTLVALEGAQAIAIAKKTHPDFILLDAVMPNMDGFETCRRLKEDAELMDIPVVFMTGLSDTESIVKGFEVGGVDYLTKPINPQELIARINVHLMNARKTQSVQTALDTSGLLLLDFFFPALVSLLPRRCEDNDRRLLLLRLTLLLLLLLPGDENCNNDRRSVGVTGENGGGGNIVGFILF